MTTSEIEWEPTEDDINWTRHELDTIEVGGTWSTGDCLFLRAEEKALTVLSVQERAIAVLDRIEVVLDAIEWTLNKEGMRIVPDDPAQQMAMAQHEASNWQCPTEDCECRLVNMDLEDAEWVNHGPQPTLDADGNEGLADRWLVRVVCHECNDPLNIAPIDYGLIAGDELFYTVNLYGSVTLRVMAREEIIKMADNEEDVGFIVGSHFINALDKKHDIPPHIQGSYVQLVATGRSGPDGPRPPPEEYEEE
jgi:hypothetical protein